MCTPSFKVYGVKLIGKRIDKKVYLKDFTNLSEALDYQQSVKHKYSDVYTGISIDGFDANGCLFYTSNWI